MSGFFARDSTSRVAQLSPTAGLFTAHYLYSSKQCRDASRQLINSDGSRPLNIVHLIPCYLAQGANESIYQVIYVKKCTSFLTIAKNDERAPYLSCLNEGT